MARDASRPVQRYAILGLFVAGAAVLIAVYALQDAAPGGDGGVGVPAPSPVIGGSNDGGGDDDGSGDGRGGVPDINAAQNSISIDATYAPGDMVATVKYADRTGSDAPVTVEILGMRESYQETFSGPEFSIKVGFASVPKYGWAVHPIVAEVDHPEFGSIQIKTEIRNEGEPAPRTIYAEQ